MIELKRGTVFDKFILIENIGSGTTADVWKVEDEKGDLKAMKIYSPTNKLTDFDKKILKKEFDFAKNLSNDNILPLESHGEFDGIPYIIMPLAETSLMQVLHDRMNKYGNQLPYFNERQLATILFDVTNALNYLKTKKLIHKDLKPDNILILLENGEERLVLMDFNISTSLKQKILSQTRSLSESTSGMTPAYAAPEFLKGKEHQNSDIFSLGITLYELAIGVTPSSSTEVGPAEILLNGGELPSLNINIFSNEFSSLIDLCLNINPELRPDAKKLFEWSDFYLNNNKWSDEIFIYNRKQANIKEKYARINTPTIIQSSYFEENHYGKNAVHQGLVMQETFKNKYSHEFKKLLSLKLLIYSLFGILLIALTFYLNGLNNEKNANILISKGDVYFKKGFINDALTYYRKAATLSKSSRVNRKINILTKLLKFDEVEPFNNGISRVKKSNKWGLIDSLGDEILPPSFKKIIPFKYGIGAVELENGGCGFINTKGVDLGSNRRYKKCEVISENKGRITIGNNIKTINLNN